MYFFKKKDKWTATLTASFLLTNCEPCPLPIWKNIKANELKYEHSLFNYLKRVSVKKSSVGIVTGYELEGLESKSVGGDNFWKDPDRPRPNQPPLQWVMSLFAWGKAAGAWRWPPTPSSTEGEDGQRCTYTASTMCLLGMWGDSLCL
jgi:hypothetical protein